MIKVFTDDAWDNYCYWERGDKKTLKRIHELQRNAVAQSYARTSKKWKPYAVI